MDFISYGLRHPEREYAGSSSAKKSTAEDSTAEDSTAEEVHGKQKEKTICV